MTLSSSKCKVVATNNLHSSSFPVPDVRQGTFMQEMNSTISTSWFYLSQRKATTEEIIASF